MHSQLKELTLAQLQDLKTTLQESIIDVDMEIEIRAKSGNID